MLFRGMVINRHFLLDEGVLVLSYWFQSVVVDSIAGEPFPSPSRPLGSSSGVVRFEVPLCLVLAIEIGAVVVVLHSGPLSPSCSRLHAAEFVARIEHCKVRNAVEIPIDGNHFCPSMAGNASDEHI